MGIHFQPHDNFVRLVELTPTLRKRIEATIEHLVSLLDTYDPDPDLEDNADQEYSLGWTVDGVMICRFQDDLEEEQEHDEDGGDSEPTLAAPERHPSSWERTTMDGSLIGRTGELRYDRTWAKSQEFWADGPTALKFEEGEEENEHGGDILDEPHDDDDNGVGDMDGAREQYGNLCPLGLEIQ